MGKFSSRPKKGKIEYVPAVDVASMKEGLPIFWPIRYHVWDLPSSIGPLEIGVLGVVNSIMGEKSVKSFNPAILELEAACHALQALRPDHGIAIFTRFWWLTDFLDNSPLDAISDLLVNANQTSASWEATLFAAATVEGAKDASFVEPALFEAIIQQHLSPSVE